ncbi:MAG: hypothetical protein M3R15_24115 [Acidobacteriota bacterium]|nr:hypothetical protein [Acidobacteriota bacterium]
MRGTKLLAWRVPLIVSNLEDGSAAVPNGSRVPRAQKGLLAATRAALDAVAEDVRIGLSETVGIGSTWVEGDRSSVVLEMPPGTDTEQIARAVDLENVEAWCDEDGRVHVGISPWYSTKDVDQVVLSITKVIHVMLGLHASDAKQHKGFIKRILASAAEIMTLEKSLAQKKDPPLK